MNPVCGGTSELKQADENVQKICDQVKGEAENKAGTKFSQFVAKSYKTQVVAGTNYFIKVDVGDGNFVHLRVYQTLPHAGSTLELSAIKTGMKEDDALQYFWEFTTILDPHLFVHFLFCFLFCKILS